MSKQPWASGPGEILRHGLSLLRKDSDTNRRLAMLSIDNSVELMMKTYLALPKRVTGISLSRRQFDEMGQSFPELLNAIEVHAADKLGGIDLAEIEWYHRLRNELYHQGNGLTVELEKVRIYAELAKLLFENLFSIEIEIRDSDQPDLLPEFMKAWSKLEKALNKIDVQSNQDDTAASATARATVQKLAADTAIDRTVAKEILSLQELRNSIVHSEGRPETAKISSETIVRIKSLGALVESKLAEQGCVVTEAQARVDPEEGTMASAGTAADERREEALFASSGVQRRPPVAERRRAGSYRRFFQTLVDELREKHHFTRQKRGLATNLQRFGPGVSGRYGVSFPKGGLVRTEVYLDQGDLGKNKATFEILLAQRSLIEREFGEPLEWEPVVGRRAARIAVYRPGAIDYPEEQLAEIRAWAIDRLLRFDHVFGPRLE